MSEDIDIKSYSGEIKDPVAGDQAVENNSFLQEAYDAASALDMSLPTGQPEPKQPTEQELNFKAFREEIKLLKAEKEREKAEYQQQLDMLRANVAQIKPQEAPQKPKEMFDGMEATDIPSVGDFRKEWTERENLYKQRIEELEVATQFPDYREVLQKYVTPLAKDKPHLIQGALSAPNKAQALYELGKMAEKMSQPPPSSPQRSEVAEKIVENARKPGTLAQSGGQSVLSKTDYFATMSDADFMKFAMKNMDGI